MTQIFFENDKLWQITLEGASFTTAYGKINSDSLRESTKSFDSEEKASKEADKLIAKKLKSGYHKLRLNLEDPVNNVCKLQLAQEEQVTSFVIHNECSEAFIKEICKIESLTELRMVVKDRLPSSIGQLKNLERLKIKGEQIQNIPDEIGQLQQLKRLSINHTGIQSLPDSIGQLQALEELEIENNYQLRHFPPSIGQLKVLKKLSIESLFDRYKPIPIVALDVLPTEIGLLSNLEELSLDSNTFDRLPDSIGQLKKLKKLSLDYNAFQEIPSSVFELENLERLSMRNSTITHLPLQLCLLTNLNTVDFHSYNATIDNVTEILLETDDAPSIQEYLIQHTEAATLKEADKKLLLHWREKLDSNAPQPVAIPVVPANKAALVAARKEQFEKFNRAVKSRADRMTLTQLEELMLYLKGSSSVLPTALVGGEYDFNTIVEVLHPLDDWNFIDQRIITFISQAAFYYKKNDYYKGYHETFALYIQTQLLENPSHPTFYTDLVKEIAPYGLEEWMLLESVLDELRELPLLTEDKHLNSFGQYLLNAFEQEPDKIVALISKHSHATRFVELMVLYKEEGLKPQLPKLLVIKDYKGYDGNKHVPFLTLDVLCAANTDYTSYVLDMMEQIDCVSCKMECYRILYASDKEKYAASTLEKIKEALVHISDKKNGGERYQFQWSTSTTNWTDDTAFFVDWACGHFGEAVRQPLFDYVENTKVLDLKVIDVAVKQYGQNALDIAAEALNMHIEDNTLAKHYKTTFALLGGLDFSKYYDKVWEIAQSKFTEIADTACVALSRQEPAAVVPKATQLLTAKSIPARRAGVFTLALIGTPETQALIAPFLATEKNEDIRNIIVHMLMGTPIPISITEAQERVASAAARGKLSKPTAKWLEESKLPQLSWRNKTPLTTEEIRFLLYRQKSRDSIETDFEAREVLELVDPTTSGLFAKALWSLLQKNGGAKAKNRFAMGVVAALADDTLIPALYKETTTAKNLNTCVMLGVMNSLEAARSLDKIKQFFDTKYPNVRAAAEAAFEAIATTLKLSTFELSDKMLPDLAFKNRKRTVAVGTEEYTAIITKDFRFSYKNPSGKVVKSISKADKVIKEEWKQLGKTLKNNLDQFLPNLEFYLVTQRAWSYSDWSDFFRNNPIAFAAAQNFVWQVYDPNNVATGTFVLTEENDLVDYQGQAYPVDERAFIRLVHPLLLDASIVSNWTTYLQQQQIIPPFSQLTRPVFAVPISLQDKTMDYQYYGFRIDGYQFKSSATKKGWKRGAVIDSGEISSYQKVYPTIGIQAIIKTINLNVQYNEELAVLQEFYFVHLGTVVQGSYTYDEPRKESDPRLIRFDQVPPIVYSETIADLQTIAVR